MQVLPYGADEKGAVAASHAFTTYDRDPRTQLDYAVNRFYDRGTGRFLQPDPLGASGYDPMDPTSFNSFVYVGDDPANGTDPLGLDDYELERNVSFNPEVIEFNRPVRVLPAGSTVLGNAWQPARWPPSAGLDSIYFGRGHGSAQGSGADPRSAGSASTRVASGRTEWADWKSWDLTRAAALSTGFADSITFGITRLFRPEGIVNEQSTDYNTGDTVGELWWILAPPAAGARGLAILSRYSKGFGFANKNRYVRFGWGRGADYHGKWSYRMSIGPHRKGQSAFIRWLRHWRV